mmetsp:Transcript_63848/g.208147  ORF Transcript_63848/g.208147 Transcript_63848/m.208147 type:complete len:734 (+) Transcript_63848:145-2346(+)
MAAAQKRGSVPPEGERSSITGAAPIAGQRSSITEADDAAQAERERMLAELPETHLLLWFAKGWLVRQATRALCVLEDHVLLRPTPGPEALERLVPTPRQAAEEDVLGGTSPLGELGSLGGTGLFEQLNNWGQNNQHRLERLEECDEENLTDTWNRPGGHRSDSKGGAADVLNAVFQGGQAATAARAQKLGVTPLQLAKGPPGSAKVSARAPGSQRSVGSRKGSKALGSTAGREPKQLGGMMDSHRDKALGRTGESLGGKTLGDTSSRPGTGTRPSKSLQSTTNSTGDSRKVSKTSRGMSRQASKAITESEPPVPSLTLEGLAYRLGQVESVQDPTRSAQLIMNLFGVEELLAEHFARIAVHHRLRRRNLLSRVQLRLTIVQHGDSFRAPPPPMSPAAASMAAGGEIGGTARELTPPGWAQVTRTAWAMRLCPNHTPTVVLTSSVACCMQTAERLRALADDADVLEAESGMRDSSYAQERQPCRPHPEALHCAELDFPDVGAALGAGPRGMAPVVYSLTEAIARAVEEAFDPDAEADMAPVATVMLVAGGALLEALIACLNSHLPAKERLMSMASGRLGGGDAVLLESPTMLRIVGETEEEERFRPAGEMWREGLRKSKWRVVKHLTGDGRRPWGEVKKNQLTDIYADRGEVDLLITQEDFKAASETRNEWKRYCGEPLVLSQKQFSNLCERAGSLFKPMDKLETDRLRPLIKGFKERPPTVVNAAEGAFEVQL